ncbi:MAG: tetratricopeptide repeat protein, partial [Desulfobulbaceae bacterium]|nr:tetratricopeptide repeat protein [Desulfobulbaceae bacterium]
MKCGNRKTSALNLSEELGKATNLHQNGQFQQAEVIYKKILRHRPTHPDALHMLGILYNQTGKLNTGIDLMRKSIKSAPGRPDYLFNLARAYHDREDFDNTIATYHEYLRLVPD